MEKNDYEYVIFDKDTKKMLSYDNGEVIFYADKSEAEIDLAKNEEVLSILIKQ